MKEGVARAPNRHPQRVPAGGPFSNARGVKARPRPNLCLQNHRRTLGPAPLVPTCASEHSGGAVSGRLEAAFRERPRRSPGPPGATGRASGPSRPPRQAPPSRRRPSRRHERRVRRPKWLPERDSWRAFERLPPSGRPPHRARAKPPAPGPHGPAGTPYSARSRDRRGGSGPYNRWGRRRRGNGSRGTRGLSDLDVTPLRLRPCRHGCAITINDGARRTAVATHTSSVSGSRAPKLSSSTTSFAPCKSARAR